MFALPFRYDPTDFGLILIGLNAIFPLFRILNLPYTNVHSSTFAVFSLHDIDMKIACPERHQLPGLKISIWQDS